MAFWRMQLHPNEGDSSARYAAASVSRGLIGLDFESDVGDLRSHDVVVVPRQKDYRVICDEMKVGDLVLVQAHHYPFALVEIASEYMYIPTAPQTLGVWFRHLRAIRNPRLYADWKTNPKEWQRIPMTDTIAPLRSESGIAYGLIQKWMAS